jgi:hypothetical protein
MMNKLAALCGASVVSLLSVNAALASECSAASLTGHYTYWLQGADESGNAYAEVGQETYDGAGNVTSQLSVAGSGAIEEDTGTYTVNADCSGTVSYASGASYNIFVAPSGDSFVFSSSTAGVVQAGENTRVDMDAAH